MIRISYFFVLALLLTGFNGCKKTETTQPKLIFKFKFDPAQARYDSFGNLQTSLPAGHAGQSPSFNAMSAHYIELSKTQWDSVGKGTVLYLAPEVTTGGAKAIDFSKSVFAKDGETFYSVNLKDVTPGDYEYLRVSLAYQNYTVNMNIDTTWGGYPVHQEFPATIASFIGYNTYITSYQVNTQSIGVNGNRKQGYWGFESLINIPPYYNNTFVDSGQAPGVTTVVNPIFATSPIPSGSCLVTGAFSSDKLHITGNETKDVVVTVSLSTNKSFEWIEQGTPDNKWSPLKGEVIVDMGIRGMIPSAQY